MGKWTPSQRVVIRVMIRDGDFCQRKVIGARKYLSKPGKMTPSQCVVIPPCVMLTEIVTHKAVI